MKIQAGNGYLGVLGGAAGLERSIPRFRGVLRLINGFLWGSGAYLWEVGRGECCVSCVGTSLGNLLFLS